MPWRILYGDFTYVTDIAGHVITDKYSVVGYLGNAVLWVIGEPWYIKVAGAILMLLILVFNTWKALEQARTAKIERQLKQREYDKN